MNETAAAPAETKAEEATPPVPEGEQNGSSAPAETAPEGDQDSEKAPEADASAPADEPEAPAAPTGPVVVDEVTRLRAENINLKLIGVVNRETILQQQLNDLGKERASLNEKMQVLQAEIEKAYDIDLQTHHILPDTGVVIPRNAPPGGMDPRMAAMLAQRLKQQKG